MYVSVLVFCVCFYFCIYVCASNCVFMYVCVCVLCMYVYVKRSIYLCITLSKVKKEPSTADKSGGKSKKKDAAKSEEVRLLYSFPMLTTFSTKINKLAFTNIKFQKLLSLKSFFSFRK